MRKPLRHALNVLAAAGVGVVGIHQGGQNGVVIRERIHRWRWRTLRNSATGGVRYERGPLTVQWEHGAGQVKLGRLLFIRCASKHPYQWMLVWRTSNYPVWHGSLQNPDKYPMPWTIVRRRRRGARCLFF